MGPGLFAAILLLVIIGFGLVMFFMRRTPPAYVPMPLGPAFNYQAVFEKVAAHLITQGKRSMSPGGSYCMYRTPKIGGKVLMCAVGCLITDACYRGQFENQRVDSYDVIEALRCSLDLAPGAIDTQAGYLLRDLQLVHDTKDPEEWRHHLRVLARTYKLKVPVWL